MYPILFFSALTLVLFVLRVNQYDSLKFESFGIVHVLTFAVYAITALFVIIYTARKKNLAGAMAVTAICVALFLFTFNYIVINPLAVARFTGGKKAIEFYNECESVCAYRAEAPVQLGINTSLDTFLLISKHNELEKCRIGSDADRCFNLITPAVRPYIKVDDISKLIGCKVVLHNLYGETYYRLVLLNCT